MARRPRRHTLLLGGPLEKPRSQTPDRVRISTQDAVELSVPHRFAAHRNRIVAIVKLVNATSSESHEKLEAYLKALDSDPEFKATYHNEIIAARTMLGGVMGGNWKDILSASRKHDVLLPMIASLNS